MCRIGDGRFFVRARSEAAGILCVFQGFRNEALAEKIRHPDGRAFPGPARIKRERGEIPVRPAYSSRFRIERSSAVMHPKRDASGGQNLAALCTAAGQNLTAIGSSHSLPETVDLGTMAVAGLVGTLHGIHLLKNQ